MEIIHRNYHEIFPGITCVKFDQIITAPSNPRRYFSDQYIDSLAKSINADGLIQPITVRPIEGGKFEVAAGECRFRAWKILVGHGYNQHIPCNIRKLTDQEMADIQMAENLARKDLSPLDEAYGYHVYAKSFPGMKYKDLAERFGKTAGHVAKYLQLLRLTAELQKDLNAGILPVKYALEIARLKPEDQEKVWQYAYDGDRLRTLSLVKTYIDTHIMVSLDDAPFDPESKDLFPEAGSCQDCHKQTGNRNVLFSELKDKDVRCLDRTCFSIKTKLHVVTELARIANEEPDLLLLSDMFYPMEPHALDVVNRFNLPVRQIGAYLECDQDDEAGRDAFVITGPLMGKIIRVKEAKRKVKQQAVATNGAMEFVEQAPAEQTIDEQIETAIAWRDRVQELHDEKVYADMKAAFYSEENRALIGKMNETEEICLFLFLWECITPAERDQVKDRMPSYFDDSTPERLFKSLKRLASGTIGLLFRIAFEEKFGSRTPAENGGYFLNLLMRSHYSEKEIQSIEAPHSEELEKRLATAKDRIDRLQRKKERLTEKS